MSGDMPKVWWSPSDQALYAKRFDHGYSEIAGAYDIDELPEDAVLLKPVSAAPAAPEALARLFHETYERLAPSFGYRTREASAVPWGEVPEANRRLMVAVAGEVLKVVAPAAPVEDTLCASCSHRAGTHLDGVGDCAAGSLYSKCRCDGFEAPVEAATTIEWRLTADDTFSHLHAWWTFESEAAARMWLADLDTGRYRNLKLEYRTIHRSVWVTDDV